MIYVNPSGRIIIDDKRWLAELKVITFRADNLPPPERENYLKQIIKLIIKDADYAI